MSTGALAVMSDKKILGRDRYEVESDLRVLKDHCKIMGDSKRMASVKKLVKEELGALKSLAHEQKEGLGDSSHEKMEY